MAELFIVTDWFESISASHLSVVCELEARADTEVTEEGKQLLHTYAVFVFLSALDKMFSLAIEFLYVAGDLTPTEQKKFFANRKEYAPNAIICTAGFKTKYDILRSKKAIRMIWCINIEAYCDYRNQLLHSIPLRLDYAPTWEERTHGYIIKLYGPFLEYMSTQAMYQIDLDMMKDACGVVVAELVDYFHAHKDFQDKMQHVIDAVSHLPREHETEIGDFSGSYDLKTTRELCEHLNLKLIGKRWCHLLDSSESSLTDLNSEKQ